MPHQTMHCELRRREKNAHAHAHTKAAYTHSARAATANPASASAPTFLLAATAFAAPVGSDDAEEPVPVADEPPAVSVWVAVLCRVPGTVIGLVGVRTGIETLPVPVAEGAVAKPEEPVA